MRNTIWSGVWTGVLLLLACPSAFGQYTENPPPVDSPYWWTLTDEITPEELMHRLQDPEENRRRYREGMAKGQATKFPEAYLAEHIVSVRTRELTPMWDAFDGFALRFRGLGTAYPEAATELESAGVSRAGIETILGIAHQHLRQRDALREELGPKQRAFAEFLTEAKEALGERYRPALESRDIAAFARISGRSEAEVADLMAAWERDPGVEVSLESIQLLKLELAEEDWDRFRGFLLREVASEVSYSVSNPEG